MCGSLCPMILISSCIGKLADSLEGASCRRPWKRKSTRKRSLVSMPHFLHSSSYQECARITTRSNALVTASERRSHTIPFLTSLFSPIARNFDRFARKWHIAGTSVLGCRQVRNAPYQIHMSPEQTDDLATARGHLHRQDDDRR